MKPMKIALVSAFIIVLALGVQWLLFPLFVILVIERDFGYLQSADFFSSLPLLFLFVFLSSALGYTIKRLTKKQSSHPA